MSQELLQPAQGTGSTKHGSADKPPPQRQQQQQQHVSRHAFISSSCPQYSVSIGHGTVIHPKAVIVAKDGPITIGDYCVMDEFSKVVNDLSRGQSHPSLKGATSSTTTAATAATVPPSMVIGSYNHICSRAEVYSASIGDQNTVMPYAYLGTGSILGNSCRVEPYARVSIDVTVPNETVVFATLAPSQAKRQYFVPQEEKDEMVLLTRALRATMKD
jgi:carbonic anhydrase/acetyltransferase-like protein (isoleucine patch superfamily)